MKLFLNIILIMPNTDTIIKNIIIKYNIDQLHISFVVYISFWIVNYIISYVS